MPPNASTELLLVRGHLIADEPENTGSVQGIKTRLLELGDDEESLRSRAADADFISPETLELF